MTKLESILSGLVILGLAVIGVKTGRAPIRFSHVDREKEPVGFWLAILVQIVLGTTAIIYGCIR